MILNQDKCSDQNLQQLLREDDMGPEYQSLLVHVDQCSDCQRRLEQLAAESCVWQEATSTLSSNDGSDFRVSNIGKWTRPGHPTAWNESMASRLLSPASHPEMLGSIGRYDVERMIGSGGMGLVFKAHDTELNRPVAVKLLSPNLAGIGSSRKRFAREARAAAAVMDDHVVAIHNVESSDDPNTAPFLVMRYIAGGSLQQRIDHNGHLDVCEVLRIALHTAKGLAAAHAQGLIHRDVKPSNILLDEGVERALLTDFGLALTEDDACLTRTGFHPGTPHYMSPEQVRGESIDARSDQFGLGCVIYAMCTGRPPFRAETSFAVLRRITDDNPRPIREINPDVPLWLEQVVQKLLSKERENRFDSAEQVAELLEGCLAHIQQPTQSQLPTMTANLSRKGKSQQTWWKYLGVAAAVTALAFAGILIVLELNKGTLRIECDSDNIPIRVVQGTETVKEMTLTRSGKSIRVAAGQYIIEIDGEFSNLEVTDETVSLSRGETQVVQIKKSTNQDPIEQDADVAESNTPIETSPPLFMPVLGAGQFLGGTSPLDQVADSPAMRELNLISIEHANLSQAYQKAIQEAVDATELNKIYAEMDPSELMPEKYLAFEAKHRGSQIGFQALALASSLTISGGGPNATQGRAETIDRLMNQYLEFSGLENLVTQLSACIPTPRVTQLLESLVARNPELHTRAAALIQLIKFDKLFLDAETQLPFVQEQLETFLAKEPLESSARIEYREMVAQLAQTDFDKLRIDVNEKLERLAQLCDTKVRYYGTAQQAAKCLSHVINHVVIGQSAPELDAIDLAGNPFRLSELRGKVVVLIFSQDKDFGEMYGPVRQLVARYRQAPVQVVGIMGNNNREELKAAADQDEIIWQAIPEPVNGPLYQNWGVEGFPMAYIIGADGTLHPPIHMPFYGAGGYDTLEIREKLDKVLEEIYESKRVTKTN